MNPLIKKNRHAGNGTTVATSELVTESDISDINSQPHVISITTKAAVASFPGSSRGKKTIVHKNYSGRTVKLI